MPEERHHVPTRSLEGQGYRGGPLAPLLMVTDG
jgi:hypothetical protein